MVELSFQYNKESYQFKHIYYTGIVFVMGLCLFSMKCDAASVENNNKTLFDEAIFTKNIDLNTNSFEWWLEKEGFSPDFGMKNEAYNLAVQGEELLNKGEINKGIRLLEQAWKLDSTLSRAGNLIAINQLKSKQYNKALETSKKIQSLYPKQAQGYVFSGFAYGKLREKELAKKALKIAIKIQPGSPDASRRLAQYSISDKNFDEARNYYQDALTHNPNDLPVIMELAKLDVRTGRFVQSVEALEKAIDKHKNKYEPSLLLAEVFFQNRNLDKALVVADAALERFPKNAKLKVMTGLVYMEKGLVSKSVEYFKIAINEATEATDFVIPHYHLARAYIQLKDVPSAMNEVKLALKKAPEHAASQFLLANILVIKGQLDEAKVNLQKLSSTFPDRSDIKALQAKIALKQKRPKDAIILLKEVLKQKDTPSLILQLAMAHQQNSDNDAAYAVLRDWLENHPKDVLVRWVFADLLRANQLLDEAEQRYQEVLQLRPKSSGAINNIAGILEKKGILDKALDYAKKAHDLAPNNPQIMDTLAVILLKKGSAVEAMKLLQLATKYIPKNLDIQFHLAQAMVELNKIQEAKNQLNKILSQNRQFDEMKDAKGLLKKIGVR